MRRLALMVVAGLALTAPTFADDGKTTVADCKRSYEQCVAECNAKYPEDEAAEFKRAACGATTPPSPR